MLIDESRKLDVAAVLRMTEYLKKAALDLGLSEAARHYSKAFDIVALSGAGQTQEPQTLSAAPH